MKSIALVSITSLLLFSGCGRKSETAATSDAAKPADAQLAQWFTDQVPVDPVAIHLIRSTAKPGDEVTVSGRIMGRSQPFVDGRAAFILGDPAKLTPCNERPDDECKTPWDNCCDSKEARQEGTATIQITGPDGRVLNQSLKGVHGLSELATVTLTGKVAPNSTAEALVINATLIHVAAKP